MRQSGSRSHVVAVIGDGALTGGMAWEAINHAAHLARPLIVILNDNEMSISTNVGAIARYLNTLRTTRLYRQTKQDVQGVLKGIGSLGDSVWRWATRFKDSLKYLLVGSGDGLLALRVALNTYWSGAWSLRSWALLT
ncbi:MAG: 1-deoxy-D-xylulose-5-phosphate synthase [Firmicutes bacterium]|nr:1-deoxy-D-xylulose-5-phosphate synthase [candidate division NPL-UPA2 bacterium]